MKLLSIPPGQAPILARIRKICLALPETSEAVKWGHPNFLVGKKIFAAYGVYHERPTFGSKQTLVDQALLVEDERFFRSPYVGKHGWVSMYTDGRLDWGLVEDLLVKSYRLVAPKRLVATLDGATDAPPARRRKA
ncbi:MAG: MmcQ/YjbR family DNA-binding protein [Planctomycetota bacterium]